MRFSAGHAGMRAEEIIRQVYEELTGYSVPRTPVQRQMNDGTSNAQQGRAAAFANNHPIGSLWGEDLAGQPGGGSPARDPDVPGGSPASRQNARGTKQNANIKCPCRREYYKDTKELVACKTCKSADPAKNRHVVQHAVHMGYDMSKFDTKVRAAHMCEHCRVDYADPFWKQFPAPKSANADVRDTWVYPLTFLRKSPVRFGTIIVHVPVIVSPVHACLHLRTL